MNFKGISHVKWNYPPKGIEKIKAISHVKLKVSILISFKLGAFSFAFGVELFPKGDRKN